MKFLHAADIHLDSPLKGLERYEGAPVDEIRGATRRAFDLLVALAIEERVDFVLIAGDVYDGDWKDYNSGLYFVERMRRLQSENIPVYLLAGNHDADSVITRKLRLPDNVYTFSTKKPERFVIEALNVAIHGQGFAKRAVTEDISQAYPQGDPQLFNIGVLHTCLDGKPGHDPYAPCTVDGLRSKGYQYWALGHIHTREEISSDPWIVFSGNIQGRHARETGPKGCTLVSVDNGSVESVVHQDLDVMRWVRCELDVSDCDSADDIYERVHNALQLSLDDAQGRSVAARIVLQGASAAHAELHADREHWVQEYRSVASGLGGAGIWVEKVSIKTRNPVSLDDMMARDDALGALLDSIAQMTLDDSTIALLSDELAALRTKLPPGMFKGEDAYDPCDPDVIKAALVDIEQLLVNRLLSTHKPG